MIKQIITYNIFSVENLKINYKNPDIIKIIIEKDNNTDFYAYSSKLPKLWLVGITIEKIKKYIVLYLYEHYIDKGITPVVHECSEIIIRKENNE